MLVAMGIVFALFPLIVSAQAADLESLLGIFWEEVTKQIPDCKTLDDGLKRYIFF